MAKLVRPTESRTDDRAALTEQIASLRRENAELKAKLARGPVDDTWFTPGVMAVLALGVFFALWARYVPSAARAATAPVVAERPAGEYNPTARPPSPSPSPARAPAPSH